MRLALAAGGTASQRRLIVLDRRGTLAGRGAYLCRDGDGGLPARGCLELARSRGGLNRTLRVKVPIDPELVESVLDE